MADRWYRAANLLGRALLSGLGVEIRWTGVEHVPESGPVVIAANHVSFPDFVFVERAAITRGRLVRFLCRHDVWEAPAVGLAMDRMGHVPVDRGLAATAYLRARRLLRRGEAVGVFPEAGISHSFTVRPMMRGAVALARETGAPLVPVAIWGGQRIFSVGATRKRPDLRRGRPVDLDFGRPIDVPPEADLVEVTRRLGAVLTDRLEALQGLSPHRPRPGEHASWYPAHLGGAAPSRHRALALDDVPRGAVRPTWGPEPEVYDEAPWLRC